MADPIGPLDEGEPTIGERILIARRRRGMKLEELARRVGIDNSTLSRYERGRRVPRAHILGRLARELRTTPDALLGFRMSPDDRAKLDKRGRQTRFAAAAA